MSRKNAQLNLMFIWTKTQFQDLVFNVGDKNLHGEINLIKYLVNKLCIAEIDFLDEAKMDEIFSTGFDPTKLSPLIPSDSYFITSKGFGIPDLYLYAHLEKISLDQARIEFYF